MALSWMASTTAGWNQSGRERNLISGNVEQAVRFVDVSNVTSSATMSARTNGTAALENGDSGLIFEGGSDNVVSLNVLSGNQQEGVKFRGTTNSQILGNLIGTNASGTSAIPNGQDGIGLIDASGITIGGTTADLRNTVSANQGGISLEGSSGNTIIGNRIGTRSDGTGNLGNGFSGISISGSNNQVGGAPGAGNVIANTVNASGIRIANAGDPSIDNLIQGNSIPANAGSGIDIQTAKPDPGQLDRRQRRGRHSDRRLQHQPCGRADVEQHHRQQRRHCALISSHSAVSAFGVTGNDQGRWRRRARTACRTSQCSVPLFAQHARHDVRRGPLNSTANTEFPIELFLACPGSIGPRRATGADRCADRSRRTGRATEASRSSSGGLGPGHALTAIAINERRTTRPSWLRTWSWSQLP